MRISPGAHQTGYRRDVDQETMLGALCAHLLISMAFAFGYRALGPPKLTRSSVPTATAR